MNKFCINCKFMQYYDGTYWCAVEIFGVGAKTDRWPDPVTGEINPPYFSKLKCADERKKDGDGACGFYGWLYEKMP